MQYISFAVKWILDAGAPVMMPLIITIFGLCFRQGLGKSLRSGVTVGIGLIGMNTIIAMITGALGPAAKEMVARWGIHLTGMDITVAAPLAWSLPTATLIIPLIIVVNVVMLLARITKTFHIDLWNYWHFAYAAGIVWIATGSYVLGFTIAVIVAFFTYILADWTYPAMEDPEGFNMPGVTLPHHGTVVWAPPMYALNKVIDRIPGVRNLKADPDSIREKLGVVGEPLFIGLVLGLLIGFLAGYPFQKVLNLAMYMSAGLIILPRVMSIIVEGLIPLADGIRDQMIKWFPGRDLRIGMDAAIVVGNPALLSASYLMVPIALVLSIILPGNTTLPYSILPVLMFPLIWAAAPSKGNIVRTVIGGIFVVSAMLYCATLTSPFITEAVKLMKIAIPAGTVMVADMVSGGRQLFPAIALMIILPLVGKASMTLLYAGIAAVVIYALAWWWAWDEPKNCAAKKLHPEEDWGAEAAEVAGDD